MAGGLAGVETATVPAARHDVHLDNAAGFTDVLVRFPEAHCERDGALNQRATG
jgi:hypothetical protein